MGTKTPLVSVISYPCSDFSSLFLELREKGGFENVHLKPQCYEDHRSRIAQPYSEIQVHLYLPPARGGGATLWSLCEI